MKKIIIIFVLVAAFVPAIFAAAPSYVVFTFDDGPYPQFTQEVLDILAKYKIKATFFLTGRWVDKYPEIVRLIDYSGHDIGMHGYYHLDLTVCTKEQFEREIYGAKESLERVLDKKIRYFRPPAGVFNKKAQDKSAELGLKIILWNIYPLDYGRKNADEILKYIKKRKFKKYNILLLHNGLQQTTDALESVIKNVISRKIKIISMEEFLKITKSEDKKIIDPKKYK